MSSQRPSFAKRQRETDLKDKARQKRERRAVKADNPNQTKGPQIAWDEEVRYVESPMPPESSATPGADGADVQDNTSVTPDATQR
jgi:hypothetical protein